jgi:radical SAM superfamily enzyme YgiQ (UPF0313 family)
MQAVCLLLPKFFIDTCRLHHKRRKIHEAEKREPMKSILMLAINSSWSQSNLALYYLREVIRELPHRVIMNSFTLSDHLGDVLHEVYRAKPDVICFSAYIWNSEYLQKLIPELKKLLPDTIMVIGGPQAEHAQFGLTNRDFMITGSGEASFRALAMSDFRGIHGEHSFALCDVPFPYRASDGEQLGGKLVYYECFRGCPYSCVYCLSALDKRNEPRFDADNPADLSRLDAELEALIAIKPKTLKFIDRSFNVFPKLARHIWSFFIRHPHACEVHFEIYPDLLSEEDFIILEQAPEGLIRFEVGIQTTNDAIAAQSARKSNWTSAKQALINLKQRTKIRVHADLLAGLPGESIDSVHRSINQLCATLPDAVQLGTLKILPATPMLDIAKSRGYTYLSTPPYQCLSSDALSYLEMNSLEAFAKLLNLYWNKEEHTGQWQIMLQSHSATDLLAKLRELHKQHGFELHSLAKAKRDAIMQELLQVI